MKKQRKTTAFLLSLLMTLSLFAGIDIGAFAQETEEPTARLGLRYECNSNGSIPYLYVTVFCHDENDLVGGQLELTYNDDLLDCVYTEGCAVADKQSVERKPDGTIVYSFSSLPKNEHDMDLFTVSFAVRCDAFSWTQDMIITPISWDGGALPEVAVCPVRFQSDMETEPSFAIEDKMAADSDTMTLSVRGVVPDEPTRGEVVLTYDPAKLRFLSAECSDYLTGQNVFLVNEGKVAYSFSGSGENWYEGAYLFSVTFEVIGYWNADVFVQALSWEGGEAPKDCQTSVSCDTSPAAWLSYWDHTLSDHTVAVSITGDPDNAESGELIMYYDPTIAAVVSAECGGRADDESITDDGLGCITYSFSGDFDRSADVDGETAFFTVVFRNRNKLAEYMDYTVEARNWVGAKKPRTVSGTFWFDTELKMMPSIEMNTLYTTKNQVIVFLYGDPFDAGAGSIALDYDPSVLSFSSAEIFGCAGKESVSNPGKGRVVYSFSGGFESDETVYHDLCMVTFDVLNRAPGKIGLTAHALTWNGKQSPAPVTATIALDAPVKTPILYTYYLSEANTLTLMVLGMPVDKGASGDIIFRYDPAVLTFGSAQGCGETRKESVTLIEPGTLRYSFSGVTNVMLAFFIAEFRVTAPESTLCTLTASGWSGSDTPDGFVMQIENGMIDVHGAVELRNAVDATCTSSGYTGDLYCADCGLLLQTGEPIAASGHRFGKWSVVPAADDAQPEWKERVCALCGEKEVSELGADDFSRGDVDGDGKVSAADARYALRCAAKLESLDDYQFAAADIDQNGEVRASDARMILRVCAKIDSFA